MEGNEILVIKQGYAKKVKDTDVSKVKFFKTKIKGIPLIPLVIIRYHQLRKDFVKLINKHLHFLCEDDEVKKHLLLLPYFHFVGDRNGLIF